MWKFLNQNGCIRYSEEDVVSHNQNKIRSTAVENPNEILLLASNCDVVAIDEAQFFDESIVDVANQLANSGIRVVIAGLDMDFWVVHLDQYPI